MKIYCTMRNVSDDGDFLSQLVGSDAWVKVKSHTGNILWIRLVSETPLTYVVNVIDGNDNRPYKESADTETYLNRITEYRKDHITVCKPLDVLHTADIFCS